MDCTLPAFTVYGLLFVVFLYVTKILKSWAAGSSCENFPPGPKGLPVIGNLHMINLRRPNQTLMKFAKQYGSVFSIRMGTVKIVVLSGYETVRSALIDHAEEFSERPYVPVFEDVFQGYGISFSHGENWRTMRRFTLTKLRDFGMGKRTIEDRIVEECGFFTKMLQSLKGEPVELTIKTNFAIGNIIMSIVFGQRFDYRDPLLIRVMELIDENMRLFGSPSAAMYNYFPALRYICGARRIVMRNMSHLHSFLRMKLMKHLQELDRDDQRGFIDAFLIKQEEEAVSHQRLNDQGCYPFPGHGGTGLAAIVDGRNAAIVSGERSDPNTYFHEKNLMSVVSTLLMAGTETTSSTIRWALIYMIQYPDIQRCVQEEIDRVIGSAQPRMEHRKDMPYTNAVVHEIQRRANILPMNLPRETTKDVIFQGYHIPKGTYVTVLLESVLYDKSQFEHPESFYPEHFLDSNGAFVKKAAFIPFSAGRRSCVGETLAKMELFLFFTSLMQKFTFHAAPGVTNLQVKPSIGLAVAPVGHKICCIPRS